MSLRIGVGLFTGQIPPGDEKTFAREYRDILELARLAEALGFDSAWVSEHHGASDGYLPSLLVMLGAIAAVTGRIRLGTGLLLTPFHDPLRLAEDAAVVDQLSDGRLDLGLGLGWRPEEFRMFGAPFTERAVRTDETIQVLRRAWTGERFSFEGRTMRFDRVRITPSPAQEGGPPILVGGYVDPTFRRAGRLGDGYVGTVEDLDRLQHAVTAMDEAAREADRASEARLRLVTYGYAFPSDAGADAALATVRRGLQHQWGAYDAWDLGHDTPEHDSIEPPAPDEQEIRTGIALGTPEEIATALRPVVEQFASERDLDMVLMVHEPGMDLDTSATALELLADRTLPALRGR